MAVREGRWDCTTCSSRAILGRHKICPGCGNPRPEDVKFYLPEDAEEVKDEELLDLAEHGPDWICDYCEASNRGDATRCFQCAAERDSQRAQAVKEYSPDAVPRQGDVPDDEAPRQPAPKTPPPAAQPAGPGCAKLLIPVAAVGLIIIGLIVYLTWPRQQIMTVDARQWERSVVVEELRTLTEEGWSLPQEGRLLSQQQAVHHHKKVVDRYETKTRQVTEKVQVGTEEYVSGKRDKGNGFFEDVISTRPVYENRTRTETYQEPIHRQEPVYQTKYRYEIDRWKQLRTERSQGDDGTPQWPQLNLANKQREGPRNETYTLVLRDDANKLHRLKTSFAQWQQLTPGSKCEAVMVMGKIKKVLTAEM